MANFSPTAYGEGEINPARKVYAHTTSAMCFVFCRWRLPTRAVPYRWWCGYTEEVTSLALVAIWTCLPCRPRASSSSPSTTGWARSVRVQPHSRCHVQVSSCSWRRKCIWFVFPGGQGRRSCHYVLQDGRVCYWVTHNLCHIPMVRRQYVGQVML